MFYLSFFFLNESPGNSHFPQNLFVSEFSRLVNYCYDLMYVIWPDLAMVSCMKHGKGKVGCRLIWIQWAIRKFTEVNVKSNSRKSHVISNMALQNKVLQELGDSAEVYSSSPAIKHYIDSEFKGVEVKSLTWLCTVVHASHEPKPLICRLSEWPSCRTRDVETAGSSWY